MGLAGSEAGARPEQRTAVSGLSWASDGVLGGAGGAARVLCLDLFQRCLMVRTIFFNPNLQIIVNRHSASIFLPSVKLPVSQKPEMRKRKYTFQTPLWVPDPQLVP